MTTETQPPFNYRYFVQKAVLIGSRVLDYGCGGGQIVALGLERGLDIWGADTYAEYYHGWGMTVTPHVRDRIRTIRNDVSRPIPLGGGRKTCGFNGPFAGD